MEVMLDEYYEVRGWDGQGRPSKEKLAALGLDKLQISQNFRYFAL